MNILALSGSLRTASINSTLLRAMSQLALADMTFKIFKSMGQLPLFNPDLEEVEPAIVTQFKNEVRWADALVIASPEYAHGVTGVMKNALDWLVSSEVIVHKPVAVLNASPRAHHADAALRETLTVMSADIIESASVTVAIIGSGLDDVGIATHPHIASVLREALMALHELKA